MYRLITILILAFLSYSPNANSACDAGNNAICSTEGEAYANLFIYGEIRKTELSSAYACATPGTPTTRTAGSYKGFAVVYNCAATGAGYVIESYYPAGNTCSSATPISGSGQFNSANNGDIRCVSGCQTVTTQTATDWTNTNNGATCSLGYNWGSGKCPANYAWNSTYQSCVPLPPDTDGDGVPDDIDEWPTDPTRTADTDGDGIADEFDDFPTNPSESIDSDSDGIGDNADINDTDADNGQDGGTGNETDNVSTGGGTCDNPPVSSGDAIAAQIAYQTWATRCASLALLEKLKETTASVIGDVSNCSTSYSCTGNTGACAQVNALRQQICGTTSPTLTKLTEIKTAIEGIVLGGGSNIDGDVSSMSTDEGTNGITGGTGNVTENTIDDASFDSSGFLGGDRSCPEMPVIEVMGATMDFNVPHLCDYLQLGSALILLFAAIGGLRIVGTA